MKGVNKMLKQKDSKLNMELMSVIDDYIESKTMTDKVYNKLCSSLKEESELQQKYDELNTRQWQHALKIESLLSQITSHFNDSYPSEWAIADTVSLKYEEMDYQTFLIYLGRK